MLKNLQTTKRQNKEENDIYNCWNFIEKLLELAASWDRLKISKILNNNELL